MTKNGTIKNKQTPPKLGVRNNQPAIPSLTRVFVIRRFRFCSKQFPSISLALIAFKFVITVNIVCVTTLILIQNQPDVKQFEQISCEVYVK